MPKRLRSALGLLFPILAVWQAVTAYRSEKLGTVLLLAAAGVALWGGWPWISRVVRRLHLRSIRLRWPVYRQPSPLGAPPNVAENVALAEAKAQVVTLQREQAELTQKLAGVVAEHATQIKALDETARAAYDSLRKEHQAAVEELRYGMPLITVPPMTTTEYDGVRPILEVFQSSVEAVLRRANDVWAEIAVRCENAGQESAPRYLHWCLNAWVVIRLGSLAALWQERLREGRDPRSALAAIYVRYRHWRHWIICLAPVVGLETGWGSYKRWYEADQQFNEKLTELLKVTLLRDVKQVVDEYRKTKDDGKELLPQPGAPW